MFWRSDQAPDFQVGEGGRAAQIREEIQNNPLVIEAYLGRGAADLVMGEG